MSWNPLLWFTTAMSLARLTSSMVAAIEARPELAANLKKLEADIAAMSAYDFAMLHADPDPRAPVAKFDEFIQAVDLWVETPYPPSGPVTNVATPKPK